MLYKGEDKIPSQLGVEIEKFRRKHKLTQKEFGELAGIGGKYPHVTISHLETGLLRNVGLRVEKKIREVLNEDDFKDDLMSLVKQINKLGFSVTLHQTS